MYNTNYAVKEKIVLAGASSVFNNWHENANITVEAFLDALKWLCADPMPNGKLTRELACRRADSKLHRLTRVYAKDGSFAGFVEESDNGSLLDRFNNNNGNCASISPIDRI